MATEEIKEIVDTVVKKVARKIAGIYYILWASFAPAVLLAYPLLYSMPHNTTVVFFVALMAVYFIATWRLISKAYKIRREKLDVKGIVLFVTIGVLISIGFIIAGTYWRIPIIAAALIIVINAYVFLKTSGAGVKWYDHLALLPLPAVFATAPEYFPLWSIMTLTWMYAGVKSLVDIIER